jgi:hypothetical protein
MTFFFGSIAMSAFAVLWFFYHWLVKNDLHEHKEEIRVGAFVLAVWAAVWWFLFR